MEYKHLRKQVDILDCIKGIASINIIILHSNILAADSIFYLLFVIMAVPMFLICSGFNFSRRITDGTWKKLYEPHKLYERFLRFTIPIVITYGMYIIGISYLQKQAITLYDLIIRFLTCNFGPGAYYYSIMLQFLIIFPVLYKTIYYYGKKGLLLIAVINFIYEYLCEIFAWGGDGYELCIIRYLTLISCGIYIFIYRIENKVVLVTIMLAGVYYQVLLPLIGYTYRIFTRWSNTSMVVSLWIFPILWMVIDKFRDRVFQNAVIVFLGYVGKASYYIFCVQIIYYCFIEGWICTNSNLIQENPWIRMMAAIVFCVFCGIFFYEVLKKKKSIGGN